MLPITVNNVLINDEVDPAAPLFCSKSILELNGRIDELANVIIIKEIKKSTGDSLPIDITKTPLRDANPKQIIAIVFLFIPLRNLIYILGPKIDTKAFTAK
jgi:hypothetical protein